MLLFLKTDVFENLKFYTVNNKKLLNVNLNSYLNSSPTKKSLYSTWYCYNIHSRLIKGFNSGGRGEFDESDPSTTFFKN